MIIFRWFSFDYHIEYDILTWYIVVLGGIMEQSKIDRINELARKSKSTGLTEAERAEQAMLRKEFLSAIRADLKRSLDNIDFVDEDGNVTPAGKQINDN